MNKRWCSYVVWILLALAGPGCGKDDAASDGQVALLDGSLGDAPIPVSQGFGDYCSYVAHECNTGPCVNTPSSSGVGFCSKSCPKQGELCSDAPAGSRAECLLPVNNGFICQFVCSSTVRCPAPLRCNKDQEVHDGVYPCEG